MDIKEEMMLHIIRNSHFMLEVNNSGRLIEYKIENNKIYWIDEKYNVNDWRESMLTILDLTDIVQKGEAFGNYMLFRFKGWK